MTDECQNAIKSAREKLIQAETDLLASHRRLQLQEFRNQNEEITSFIKSCQGVFLSPNVFWWWAGISYATSLYSLWCILQMALQWLKYWWSLVRNRKMQKCETASHIFTICTFSIAVNRRNHCRKSRRWFYRPLSKSYKIIEYYRTKKVLYFSL